MNIRAYAMFVIAILLSGCDCNDPVDLSVFAHWLRSDSPRVLDEDLMKKNNRFNGVSQTKLVGAKTGVETQGGIQEMTKLAVVSAAFEDGGTIPKKYTCEGSDISPAISWENAPKGTKSFALICDDPDAPMGTWVHWVLFNILANVTTLPEAVDVQNQFGAIVGTNSWGKQSYGGPCPPSGKHRYYFKVYALDRTLELNDRANKEELLNAMQGAVLAEGQIMGHYERMMG